MKTHDLSFPKEYLQIIDLLEQLKNKYSDNSKFLTDLMYTENRILVGVKGRG